jgi:preprotein translocase subunit SecE
VESLAYFLLLAVMVAVVIVFLARFDQRAVSVQRLRETPVPVYIVPVP